MRTAGAGLAINCAVERTRVDEWARRLTVDVGGLRGSRRVERPLTGSTYGGPAREALRRAAGSRAPIRHRKDAAKADAGSRPVGPSEGGGLFGTGTEFPACMQRATRAQAPAAPRPLIASMSPRASTAGGRALCAACSRLTNTRLPTYGVAPPANVRSAKGMQPGVAIRVWLRCRRGSSVRKTPGAHSPVPCQNGRCARSQGVVFAGDGAENTSGTETGEKRPRKGNPPAGAFADRERELRASVGERVRVPRGDYIAVYPPKRGAISGWPLYEFQNRLSISEAY